jgi:C-terminal processing protease CtpA/Prc
MKKQNFLINEAMPIIQQLIQTGLCGSFLAGYWSWYSRPDGSPASQAELKVGDVISAIDGSEIDNLAEFIRTLYSYQIGQTIRITYFRGTTKNTAQATLAKNPTPEFQ